MHAPFSIAQKRKNMFRFVLLFSMWGSVLVLLYLGSYLLLMHPGLPAQSSSDKIEYFSCFRFAPFSSRIGRDGVTVTYAGTSIANTLYHPVDRLYLKLLYRYCPQICKSPDGKFFAVPLARHGRWPMMLISNNGEMDSNVYIYLVNVAERRVISRTRFRDANGLQAAVWSGTNVTVNNSRELSLQDSEPR